MYLAHLDALQELLLNEDCFLPSKTRAVSDTCRKALLKFSNDTHALKHVSQDTVNMLRDGQDRAHSIYSTEEGTYYMAPLHSEICYEFTETNVSSVHLVFHSDLNLDTLPGSECERHHTTRACHRLDSPQMHMPKTLCKEFKLIGELKGQQFELLKVTNNRKRSYHLDLNRKFDKLILIPESSWGKETEVAVISFDFR